MKNSLLEKEKFKSISKFLKSYLENIKKQNQGFHAVIDDQKTIKSIENFSQKFKGKFSHIVVLAIGGSALGTICLQQSLKHLYENELKSGKFPKLHVLDNIDPALIQAIEDIIDYKKTLFIVVTKSGTTPETLAQYFYFRSKTDAKKLDPKKHFVFITDPKKGLLREIANKEKIPSFEVPENVGGRFSVLTPVGLLPASLIGINIKKLITGAKKMRQKFLSKSTEENLPFQLAAIQYSLNKKGKTITVLMPYSQKLIRLADWYRQLLAESIGKKLDNQGKAVNVGLTPVNALGVTDQHSQLQLYNEGPNDKLIIFIETLKNGPTLKIPLPKNSDSDINFLKNTTFNKLFQVEKIATEQVLTANNRPNITIQIDQVNEESLGELFMLFEGSIAFLGEFFNINAYDQPGVELSKVLTKKMLSAKIN